jgi:hypothetical protein
VVVNGKLCYVHVGTPKTGTTAIQTVASGSAPALAAGGVLYPRSGIYIAGHHNLVFELMGDDRFAAGAGTWSDLRDEVRGSDAARLCLSSEAFAFLHERRADLERMREMIRGLGYTPVIVLYVRPQAEYLESLFAELAKHRQTVAFEDYVGEICRTGAFRADMYGAVETFTFAYERIAAGFAGVFGSDRVLVRRYPAQHGAVVDDFFRLLVPGATFDRPALAAGVEPVNVRETLPAVMARLLENGAARQPVPEQARTLLERLSADANELAEARFEPLRLRHLAELVRRFSGHNARLARTWGVRLPVVPTRDAVAAALGFRPRAARARKLFESFERLRNVRSSVD